MALMGRLVRAGAVRVLVVGLVTGCVMGPTVGDPLVVGLVTKTDSNPFFLTMKAAALGRADELGVELHTFAGRYDGDWETQVEAVNSLVAGGAVGILITPSDPAALSDTRENGARGRRVGYRA